MAARFRLKDAPNGVWEATRFALRSGPVATRSSPKRSPSWTHTPRSAGWGKRPGVGFSLPGIGTDHAATLLTVVGDKKSRDWLKNEASFATASAVSLLSKLPPARSRAASPQPYVGNRDANRALYMICMVRMGRDRRTKSVFQNPFVESRHRSSKAQLAPSRSGDFQSVPAT